MTVRVVRGRAVDEVDADELAALTAAHDRVVADVGTGDARFAYAIARDDPRTLVLAIDALKENLRATASRAGRRPERGGAANLVCVWASIEQVPPELRGVADAVQVILPWGRLMAGLLVADAEVLEGLRVLGRAGAAFRAVVNAEVWGEPVPAEVRDVPELTPARVLDELAPRYADHGIAITGAGLLDHREVRALRSTWARKLASSRDVPRFVDIAGTYL